MTSCSATQRRSSSAVDLELAPRRRRGSAPRTAGAAGVVGSSSGELVLAEHALRRGSRRARRPRRREHAAGRARRARQRAQPAVPAQLLRQRLEQVAQRRRGWPRSTPCGRPPRRRQRRPARSRVYAPRRALAVRGQRVEVAPSGRWGGSPATMPAMRGGEGPVDHSPHDGSVRAPGPGISARRQGRGRPASRSCGRRRPVSAARGPAARERIVAAGEGDGRRPRATISWAGGGVDRAASA